MMAIVDPKPDKVRMYQEGCYKAGIVSNIISVLIPAPLMSAVTTNAQYSTTTSPTSSVISLKRWLEDLRQVGSGRRSDFDLVNTIRKHEII